MVDQEVKNIHHVWRNIVERYRRVTAAFRPVCLTHWRWSSFSTDLLKVGIFFYLCDIEMEAFNSESAKIYI